MTAPQTPPIASSGEADAPMFTQEGYAKARRETERLSRELDITNADHVALWLEANLGDASLGWLAVRIVEAHEATPKTPPAASSGQDLREAFGSWLRQVGRTLDTCDPQIPFKAGWDAALSAPAVQPGGDLVVVPREPSRADFEKLAQLWGYTDEETAETLGAILDVFASATPQPEAEEGAHV
jgi:hypothetical protein